jgi:hypothetical protein
MRFFLGTGSPREALTEQQLRRILRAHAVSDWTSTDNVRIESRAIPHSHPIVTLNTRFLDDDDRLLATFVHEQLHWGVQTLDQRLITQLAHRYRNLPVGPPRGCRSMFSNYLHLVICSIEYQALSELVGPTRARATLQRASHYLCIYNIVMSDHDALCVLVRDHVELTKPTVEIARPGKADKNWPSPIEHSPSSDQEPTPKPVIKCGNVWIDVNWRLGESR